MTQRLKEERKQKIMKKIEERIRTTAEREQYAKAKIRQELIEMADKGDAEGIAQTLKLLAEEAEKSSTKPR